MVTASKARQAGHNELALVVEWVLPPTIEFDLTSAVILWIAIYAIFQLAYRNPLMVTQDQCLSECFAVSLFGTL